MTQPFINCILSIPKALINQNNNNEAEAGADEDSAEESIQQRRRPGGRSSRLFKLFHWK